MVCVFLSVMFSICTHVAFVFVWIIRWNFSPKLYYCTFIIVTHLIQNEKTDFSLVFVFFILFLFLVQHKY